MSSPSGFLAVDCGNTRLKATWMPDAAGCEPEVRYFRADEPEGVMEWIEQLKRDFELRGALSVVGNIDARVAETLRLSLGGNFLILTPSLELPVRIAYHTPLTLGLDRKATACGAACRFPEEMLMVVDAGTALTVDLILPGGEFIGGNISPGLQLRFHSLHDFTARLPLVEDIDADTPEFGYDTHTAIKSGVIGGWIDEIAAAALRLSSHRSVRVILTGGDAPLAIQLLPSRIADLGGGKNEIEIDHYPHLLAEGLRAIYTHHENEI